MATATAAGSRAYAWSVGDPEGGVASVTGIAHVVPADGAV